MIKNKIYIKNDYGKPKFIIMENNKSNILYPYLKNKYLYWNTNKPNNILDYYISYDFNKYNLYIKISKNETHLNYLKFPFLNIDNQLELYNIHNINNLEKFININQTYYKLNKIYIKL